MSTALLATKFFAPQRSGREVSRPLLIHRLDEGLSRKLTLVSAAAGFGKSTLISQWAHDCPYPSAWLSLDEQDRDHYRFLEHLVTSIEEISHDMGSGISALLRGSPPSSTETVLTSLVNQLTKISGKLVLVLDDYHLAASAAVNEALAFLIDHMPEQLHLVVICREAPGLALGKLRVAGQLTEIRQQDLRFSQEETVEFFNQDADIHLSRAQVLALEARTEGWISGLQLAAISLRKHKNPETFITSFAGSHHFVQDYLVEEVLHQQTPEVQAFLLRTSVLDRLCGSLCDEVLQSQGGQRILDQLDRANLFIIPLDSERKWYRYHHLFADLLRQRLGQDESSQALHRRASQWYEANGLDVDAFRQATLAKDIPSAIRLIDAHGMRLYFRGETAPVVQWLSSLSLTALNSNPSLWIAFSWSLLFAGQPTQLEEKLLNAEAAAQGPPQIELTVDTHGQIAVLRAWLAVYRNEVDAIHSFATRALEFLSPESRPARTAAHCALGVAQMFRGERTEASVAFSRVISAGRSSGNVMFAAVAATALGGIHTIEYKLHLAARTYRDAIQMIADPAHALAFEARLGLAKILYEWNELEEAESLALLCSELVTSAKSDSESGADILLARLMLTRDEGRAAEALLSRTALVTPSGQSTDRMKEAAELRVLLLLRRGEFQNAADLASKYELPIGFARTQMAQGKGSDALRLVESHRRSMEAQRRPQDVAKAMVVQVIIHQANGEEDSALRLLRMAVARAQEPGSIRLFVDEGVPMKMLLTKLQQEAEFEQYTSQLLTAFGDQGPSAKQISPAKVESPSQFSPNAFSQRELEILRLIQQGLSNQNIGEQLFVSLSTVKWHNQNIFAKLNVQRRTEAVARALQLKLL